MKIQTNKRLPTGRTRLQPIEWFEDPAAAVRIRHRRRPVNRSILERTEYVNLDIYLLDHRPARSPVGFRGNRWDGSLDRQSALRAFPDPVPRLTDSRAKASLSKSIVN